MSPILDIQKRLMEVGRIRPGAQVATGGKRRDGKPATRPVSLDAWRVTSRSVGVLQAVAAQHGGEVRKWEEGPTDDQFELFTNSPEFDVLLLPEPVGGLSQWLEEWGGGGCKHRCDGVFDELTQSPCSCDPDKPVCTPHSRLSVMLARVPTTGLFRIETQGHYAKVELAGAMELAELIRTATGRSILPAKLRLEHRKVVREGKTKQFVVPVLDFQVDVAALAAGGTRVAIGSAASELAAGPSSPVTPVPHQPAPSLAEQIAAVEDAPSAPRRKNAPPPIPATGLAPRTAIEAEAGVLPAQQQPPAAAPAGVQAEGEEDGDIGPPAGAPPSPRRARRAAADTPPEEGDGSTSAARRSPSGSERGGRVNQRRARELVEELGELFPERDERLLAASNFLGREVASFADLTPAEANKLVRWAHEMRST